MTQFYFQLFQLCPKHSKLLYNIKPGCGHHRDGFCTSALPNTVHHGGGAWILSPPPPKAGYHGRDTWTLSPFLAKAVLYLSYPWLHMYFLFWVPKRDDFTRGPLSLSHRQRWQACPFWRARVRGGVLLLSFSIFPNLSVSSWSYLRSGR